jgi:hypothetical protein
MFNPLDGWWKVWFFFRNDADVPLPVFMGNRPVPQPKWGYDVTQKELRSLQPLRDVVQYLLQVGLRSADILRTLVSHHVQPLHR